MRRALAPLNRQWRQRGLPELDIGVGLNTGVMSVGNMGSEARFDYTVLGDPVNLGARLEALTKEYRVGILCGERTAEMVRGDFVLRELDFVRVVGRDRVGRIYELVGEVGDEPRTDGDLERFADGLTAYRARDWDAAEAAFAGLLARHPDDGPSAVFQDRRALRAAPRGRDLRADQHVIPQPCAIGPTFCLTG